MQTMKKQKVGNLSLISVFAGMALTVGLNSVNANAQQLQRPPQYVLMAFDNCDKMKMWTESKTFASQVPVKFTYFLSSVYLLNEENRMAYSPVKHPRGASNIGFSKNRTEVAEKLKHIQYLQDTGHEMASHLNGHFPGASKWTDSDWLSEFSQFKHFVNDIFSLTKIADEVQNAKWIKTIASKVVGFRAPYLENNESMYTNLKKFNYKYDTSKTDSATKWPKRHAKSGTWLFPLADLTIVGTGKKTLSMDYNFFVAQAGGKEGHPDRDLHEKQMHNTYLKYFMDNYYGNRAPVHIGHHFTEYNGGAYWKAMKSFAKAVCGLPEVKCVTYAELEQFMSKNEGNIASYQAGKFTKLPKPKAEGSGFNFDHNSIQFASHQVEMSLKDSGANYEIETITHDPSNYYGYWQIVEEKDKNGSDNRIELSGKKLNKIEIAKISEGYARATVRDSKNEILSKTFVIKDGKMDVSAPEDKVLFGDLPEAHQ